MFHLLIIHISYPLTKRHSYIYMFTTRYTYFGDISGHQYNYRRDSFTLIVTVYHYPVVASTDFSLLDHFWWSRHSFHLILFGSGLGRFFISSYFIVTSDQGINIIIVETLLHLL